MSAKRGAKRAASEAVAVERAMKRIDRGVARYGASAMAKYYSPPSSFRPELKYFDCGFSVALTPPANWNTLAVPMTSYMNADGSTVSAYTDAAIIPSAVGNGYGQVVGNKYLIKKVKVRGTLGRKSEASLAATGAMPVRCRVLLVQDTQANGAQVDTATFMTDWGAGEACLNSFQAIASGSGGRIRILGDRFVTLQPAIAGGDSTGHTASWEAKQVSFTKTWKKGLKVVIKSGASTPAIASLSDMNIFLVAYFAEPDGLTSTTDCLFTGCTRCVYAD